jgi:hypothetical protein
MQSARTSRGRVLLWLNIGNRKTHTHECFFLLLRYVKIGLEVNENWQIFVRKRLESSVLLLAAPRGVRQELRGVSEAVFNGPCVCEIHTSFLVFDANDVKHSVEFEYFLFGIWLKYWGRELVFRAATDQVVHLLLTFPAGRSRTTHYPRQMLHPFRFCCRHPESIDYSGAS